MPSVAHATIFFVSAGDVEQLITVIKQANDEASNRGDDTISLQAGTFTLTVPLPSITSQVVISGDSPNVIIERASGAPDFRIFHVATEGSLSLRRLTIRGGNSVNPNLGGGGIFNEGTLVLDESTVIGNMATGSSDQGGDGRGGGGITNLGRATVINSTITGNRSTSSGGGIENFGNDKLTLINTLVTDNRANFDGGGIENGGTATITNSTIRDNKAARFGGGINNFLGPIGPAKLTLVNSSIIGNTVGLDGGGFENSGTATLTNSTISGNEAGRLGSGIGNFSGIAGVLNVNNVTVTSNRGSQGASGVSGFFNAAGSTVNISNTIIAQNAGNDCQGTFHSRGFNLIGNNSGCEASFPVGNPNANNDIVGNSANPINAMLGPLQNSGPQTLLSGSPAIDAGNPAAPGGGGNTCEPTDQRGFLRPADGPDTDSITTCDIGAFEFSASSPFSSQIKIPIRWCCVEGSPSLQNPALVGEDSINNVLLRRLTRVNDNIYIPQPNILFRSGINPANPNLNFPIIQDPNTSAGKLGDVLLPSIGAEFMQLINKCRAVWGENDKTVTGITAVHINRFVDSTGTPVRTVGFGGGSFFSNSATQLELGYIMVIDNAYLLPTSTLPRRSDDPSHSTVMIDSISSWAMN